MSLAAWVRDRLWRANNWCAELAKIRHALATERRSAITIERIFDVACATEYCDPDRGRALPLFLEACRGGHEGARARGKVLAGALGAHMTLAEIALTEGDLLVAGTAFLDAGFRELAVEPLERFVATRPVGASPTTENLRLQGVTALLALARGARFDAEREIADSLTRARQSTGRAASTAYLHAVRVAQAAQLDDRRATILTAAAHACPDDDTIAALVAARLFENNFTDELLAHFGARLELATSRTQYAERARTAGIELIARNQQPGLGLRLLRLSLEHAYTALLPGITSHIAVWELLSTHARAQHSTVDLLPLLAQAQAAPLPTDDAVYLARLALEITWRDASNTVAAKPYAAMVLDFAPDHPLAVAFVKEAAPEMEAEAMSSKEPRAAADVMPPRIASIASPPKAPSRISAPEGQVKRAEAATSATPDARRISGRMALLKMPEPPPSPAPPPPPALPPPTTSKPSGTSASSSSTAAWNPFPSPKSSPVSPPFAERAPRKVVPVDVVVELPGGGFFSTVLRDLSMSGAFIVTKRQLEVGSLVSLELRIPTPRAVTQSTHRVTARIVRRTDVGCGVAFIDATSELVAAIRGFTA